jgi:hypothetical protein
MQEIHHESSFSLSDVAEKVRRPNRPTDTYLISKDFYEAGPFTLDQLGKLAQERKFTWGHFVSRMGDNTWFPARELHKVRTILERHIALDAGDIGPAGGLIFIHDTAQERHMMEASPHDIGPAPLCDAQRLCEECYIGDVEDWRLPDADELRAFTVIQFKSGNIKQSHATLHWSSQKKDGKAIAVVVQECFEEWVPRHPHVTIASNSRIGSTETADESTLLPIRPVRVLKTTPR